MDIEWAKDGIDGTLYILQARPETVASRGVSTMLRNHRLVEKGEVCLSGRAVGDAIASGAVHIVSDAHGLKDFTPGAILVSDTTAPDWEPVMKTAAAIVTNRGGRTCHAAIVARWREAPQGRRRAGVGGAVAVDTAVHGGDHLAAALPQHRLR